MNLNLIGRQHGEGGLADAGHAAEPDHLRHAINDAPQQHLHYHHTSAYVSIREHT